jgi:hypothetical protein
LDSATSYRRHPAAAVFLGILRRQDAADTSQGAQLSEAALSNKQMLHFAVLGNCMSSSYRQPRPPLTIDTLNKAVKVIVSRRKCKRWRLSSNVRSFKGNVHSGEEGYRKIGEQVAEAILEALEQ